MLIFDHSRPARRAGAQAPLKRAATGRLPERFRRTRRPALPKVSKLQPVRHYTRLSCKSFSIDTHFYLLGSCTMKDNPRVRPACDAVRFSAPPPVRAGASKSRVHELSV